MVGYPKALMKAVANYFRNQTSNSFTEGCQIEVKTLKRVSHGLWNADVYWRKVLLMFVQVRSYFHNILLRAPTIPVQHVSDISSCHCKEDSDATILNLSITPILF